jgi:hypothetical protein
VRTTDPERNKAAGKRPAALSTDLLPVNVERSYDAHQGLLQRQQRNLHLAQSLLRAEGVRHMSSTDRFSRHRTTDDYRLFGSQRRLARCPLRNRAG